MPLANTTLPITQQAIQAITNREPMKFQACKARSASLLNAVIYSLRIISDPICSICLAILHLIKTSYYLTSSKKVLNKARIEALKASDYLLQGISSPIFNFILAGKCTVGLLQPKICYKQATKAEQKTIEQFQKHQKEARTLSHKAVRDIKNYNLRTRVTKKIERLKKVSRKTREAYSKLKLYTF